MPFSHWMQLEESVEKKLIRNSIYRESLESTYRKNYRKLTFTERSQMGYRLKGKKIASDIKRQRKIYILEAALSYMLFQKESSEKSKWKDEKQKQIFNEILLERSKLGRSKPEKKEPEKTKSKNPLYGHDTTQLLLSGNYIDHPPFSKFQNI